MHRYISVFMLFALLAMLSQVTGCAMRSDVWDLEERVSMLSNENARLRQAVSDIGADISAEDGLRHDLGGVVATYRADVYEIRTELRRIAGLIDETEYNKSRDLEELREALAQINTDLETRLARLETYVGMEASHRVEDKDALERKYPSAEELEKLGEQDLYKAAKTMFDDGEYDRALDGFRIFLERFSKSNFADNSRFWTGEIYFAEQWYERAIVEYQKVIDDYPQGNKVPAAYLKQGIAFSLLGEKNNAVFVLNELVRKFPDQNEAKIAKSRLAELRQ